LDLSTSTANIKPDNSIVPAITDVKPDRTVQSAPVMNAIQPNLTNELLSHIPSFYRSSIVNIVNVEGDGNCGFRSIAVGLGMQENRWPQIRKELGENLEKNSEFYISLWNEKDYYDYLEVTRWEDGSCGVEKWMIMPDFGSIIANTFQRPVIYISRNQCITFVPHMNYDSDNMSLAIAYLDPSRHFVSIRIRPNAAIPPIATSWRPHANEEAIQWETHFTKEIREFNRLLEESNVTIAITDKIVDVDV